MAKRTFRKKYGKKRSWKKGKSKVKKMINRAVAPLRPEVKLHSTTVLSQPTQQSFNITGNTFLPTNQNVTEGTILGNQITAKYLRMRGSVYNGSSVDSYQMRMIIAWDHQPVANNLVLNSSTTTTGYEILTGPFIDAFVRPIKPQRFTILYDKLWTIGPKGATKNEYTYNKKINLSNKRVQYAAGLVSGVYPVNADLKVWIVSDTPDVYYWMDAMFAYTDS